LGKIVVILDNARIHHAKLLEPFLSANKNRIELVFLPPYSPKFNLIEGLWGWLKSRGLIMSFIQHYLELE
jgi:transposase